jgi:SAM-dependent methyltransferase
MRKWEKFFADKVTKILTEKNSVIDIGGSLRATPGRGNRYDPSHKWMTPLIEQMDYKILDPVNTFHPDIVGDIHNLPFRDNSQEAFFCLAVLEHIENPIRAAKELYRTLEPGGYCLVYVPFLYYYHADEGYYGDYWRFTKDAILTMFKDFSSLEVESVRGAIETWVHLSPLGRFKFFSYIGFLLDRIFRKSLSKQVSGYYVFLTK